MSKRSDRMKRIASLAESEERKVCEEMGRVQQMLDKEIDRLEELEAYRRNYAQGFKAGGSVSPVRWQDYQNFLARLDLAVDAQKRQVMSNTETRDAHRRRWLVKRQKLESLERIVDRFRTAEELEAERREQKISDDLNAAGHQQGPGSGR